MRTIAVRASLGLGLCILALSEPQVCQAQYFRFKDTRATELQNALLTPQLKEFLGHKDLRNLKIAVLDVGFGSYTEGSDMLPSTAKLIADPCKALGKEKSGKPLSQLDHGLAMAQSIWAMTGNDTKNAPQFFLLNALYFPNFKCSVEWVAKEKVDIVLYAQSFELGNMDGTGFINAVVDEALESGAIWVNAAGNYAKTSYNGPIVRADSLLPKKSKTKTDYLKFVYTNKAARDSLRFKVEDDSTMTTITVIWNDLADSEEVASLKDLDVELLDSKGRDVLAPVVVEETAADGTVQKKESMEKAAVNFRQDGKEVGPKDDPRRYSSLPREYFKANLNAGEYQIRLVDRSKNFEKSDKIRVTITTEKDYNPKTKNRGIDFIDRTEHFEVFTPADHPDVITVGDTSPLSSLGPNIDEVMKPDLLLAQSRIELTDGRDYLQGSSTASALFSGILALMMCKNPDLDRKNFGEYLEQVKRSQRTNLPVLGQAERNRGQQ